MSGESEVTVGQVLQDERVAQGITLEDAAARLRLMQRQIEAMEADDFESLGQPVFARGFVRNYARLLGLVPEALLARMEGAPAESAVVSHPEAPMPHSWLTSPWLMLLFLGLLVAVAVPVALYWWLNSGSEEEMPKHEPSVAHVRPTIIAEPVAVVESDKPVVPSDAQQEPVPPATSVAEVHAQVEATVPVPVEAPVAGRVLRLAFGGDAWAEVKDATGRVLHRQLNPSGSSVDISGQPPFELVIGNAEQVRVTYDNRPIDLKPFIAVTVARFTLEE